MVSPQIIMVVILGLNLIFSIAEHGEIKKPERKDFYKDVFYTILTTLLLYWGGFFK